MNEKQKIVTQIYEEARSRGLVHNQREFADAIEMNPSTISQALNGSERFLTDRLIQRIKKWSERNFHDEEQRPQEPDIVIPAATAALYNNMSETIRIQAEIIARLQSVGTAGISAYYTQKNIPTNR